MIAILDYGSGNILSAARAFASFTDCEIVNDTKSAINAKGLVVPGVGAFNSCLTQLKQMGGNEIIKERLSMGRPIFGICVGMQILFNEGIEKGNYSGLGLLPGKIEKLPASTLPHIGWNTVEYSSQSKLYQGIKSNYFYFVHSFGYLKQESDDVEKFAYADYGARFAASYESDLITATQFHPEKSGENGLKIIENWVNNL